MFKNKKILLAAIFLWVTVPLFAQTEKISIPSPTPVPSPALTFQASPTPQPTRVSFDPAHLKGRNGFGIGYSQHGTSLDYRHWESDNFAWGVLAWATYNSSQYNYDFSGNSVAYPNWNYALGFELMSNIARPLDDVYVQFFTIPNFSLYHAESVTSYYFSGGSYSANNKVVTERYVASVFIGPGFEAFLPFWKNISLETNMGVILSMNWTNTHTSWNPARYSTPDSYTGGSYFGADFQENGFSVLNAYIHFYF